MKITIVAVGLRQPAWADSAVEDYLGRFPKDWAVSVKAVKVTLLTQTFGIQALHRETPY